MNIPLSQQNIITLLGLESLPPERQAKLIEEASELVEQRLMVRVVESFDAKARAQFDDLVDNGTDQQIAEFIQKNAPQMPQWIDEEVAKVKTELSQNARPID